MIDSCLTDCSNQQSAKVALSIAGLQWLAVGLRQTPFHKERLLRHQQTDTITSDSAAAGADVGANLYCSFVGYCFIVHETHFSLPSPCTGSLSPIGVRSFRNHV